MVCPSCSRKIDQEAAFCSFCGVDIRPVPGEDAITIGRAPDNHIVVDYPTVSNHHCRLIVQGQKMILYDWGSLNGTFVRGGRIQKCVIFPSDTIYLGSEPLDLSLYLPKIAGQKVQHAATIPDTKQITVGRAPDNDFVIDFPQVSTHHARLFRQGGSWYVEDLGSTNGTYLNTHSARINKQQLLPDDLLFFGSYKISAFRIIQGFRKNSVLGKTSGKEISVSTNPVVLGRDPDCDFPLDLPTISWHHARISPSGDNYLLEDLNSSNGTFVNGVRITRKIISTKDTIAFGSYVIGINQEAMLVKRDYRGDIRLDVEGATVVVEKIKTILDGVTITVYPSEFVGLMGPSGAGKTTLLLALNGYCQPTRGEIRINGQCLYSNYNNFCRIIGYVPQDDIIHGALTVYEALYYTARLRFSADVSDREIEARIDRVLNDLGILECKNVLVGSAEKKGISGGQRKRVNLAMELLTDPSLLFLDEPTSGLSSEDTVVVMDVLRKLANEGKTIILTIHQPSLEIYKKMDNVIILARGKLVFYGPTFPDSLTFFNPDLPEEEAKSGSEHALRGLAKRPVEEWERSYRNSPQYEKYVKSRREEELECEKEKKLKSKTSSGSILRQWAVLVQRYWTIKRKDIVGLSILLAQAPIIAALIALVFHEGQNPMLPLFLLIIAALWFGTSNSAREIVSERAIYTRERMINLKIPPYVLSKFSVLTLLCLIQCAAMVGIVHAYIDLQSDILEVYGITLLAAMAGLSIGLCLSSVVSSSEAAIGLVPLVLLPMVILGGGIISVSDMNTYTRSISMFMPSRWAYEALVHAENENNNPEADSLGVTPGDSAAAVPAVHSPQRSDTLFGATTQLPAIDSLQAMDSTAARLQAGGLPPRVDYINDLYGEYRFKPLTDLIVLGAFIFLFLAASFTFLKMKDIH